MREDAAILDLQAVEAVSAVHGERAVGHDNILAIVGEIRGADIRVAGKRAGGGAERLDETEDDKNRKSDSPCKVHNPSRRLISERPENWKLFSRGKGHRGK